MNFTKGTIRGSPYIGIFCTSTEEIAMVPHSIEARELKAIENALDVEVMKASLGNSPLIGALSRAHARKIAVSVIAEKHEIKALESHGMEVFVLKGYECTGNLIAINRNAGIASSLLQEDEVKELERFFGVKFGTMRIAGSDLAGACLTVTNKGLICHPDISKEDFAEVTEKFKVNGRPTTANYGDVFVGNSVIANTKGAVAGASTSGIEMSKIDEGLRGD
ncbi:MAG: translation initiation factor IF-6 [Candidatus Diapherotrites archaeon]|uniref:Translation initiation factor IF-6 n=1 Tax=Candidatus Iainarchaeum sp. TaxID=3101447 RepID=A0A8T3YL91_9ARCH|nr:translation initiation factor IF-6 [Candidatus Diapherotrites archaeon]